MTSRFHHSPLPAAVVRLTKALCLAGSLGIVFSNGPAVYAQTNDAQTVLGAEQETVGAVPETYTVSLKQLLGGQQAGIRLQGTQTEARLSFSRPRNWQTNAVKAEIHYQPSPALTEGSFLTLQVNGTNVGSVPLQQTGAVGKVVFGIPAYLVKDFNEVRLLAQQKTDEVCVDPFDPVLWTEILPTSRFLVDYDYAPTPLDFSAYPYPLFDELSLEAQPFAYVLPQQVDNNWATASTRLHASLGRWADYRPLETRTVKSLDDIRPQERVVMVGTPDQQPAMATLDLPITLKNNQLIQQGETPIGDDIGVLMLTTTAAGGPVLVATGNSPAAVEKAVQFLVRSEESVMGTGSMILVDQLTPLPSPQARDWPLQLPDSNRFELSDLRVDKLAKFEETTVKGAFADPITFDFRALPDDQFQRGSTMNLVYSYSPQVNHRLSTIEVMLDDVVIAGEDLDSQKGGMRETLQVDLPTELITPTSQMEVRFRLKPREAGACQRVTDDQLWGTLHGDTGFSLKRDRVISLPDLSLMRVGYPLAAPQDLSTTALVLPDNPSPSELTLMLAMGERLGRLSRADSIQLEVYQGDELPQSVKDGMNLVVIGLQDQFPLPDLLQQQGMSLSDALSRQWKQSKTAIRTAFDDHQGLLSEMISPWNNQRVVLTLTAHRSEGLAALTQLLVEDDLFYQLEADTVLVGESTLVTSAQPEPDDLYQLTFLDQQGDQQLAQVNPVKQVGYWLRQQWVALPVGILLVGTCSYGVAAFYLQRKEEE
ncbi:MAG: cellulose biosynthesis cyclic di-GMP-binding regulatory protein BcsB [Cyanobacteria bacterium P01_A01_bin.105]